MPRSKTHDRDLGIRKISSATRTLAGAGILFVGAFSVFLASRASSSSGQSTTPVTSQVQPAAGDASGSAAVPVPNDSSQYQQQYQPQYQPAPRAQTRSGGS